jgi:hypothetical protein
MELQYLLKYFRVLNVIYISHKLSNLCENELLPRSKFPFQKTAVEQVNECDSFHGTRKSCDHAQST